ncbi:MAG: cupin domain-containing protein [Woeseia sp.]
MTVASGSFLIGQEVTSETAGEGIVRRILGHDESLLMAKVSFTAGAAGNVHSHRHSQISYIESGEFAACIDGIERRLDSGGGYYVKPHVEHAAVCRRSSVILDITLGGAIILPTLIATAYAATPLAAVFMMAVILFGLQLAIGNIQTLPSDFFAGKSVGSLAGAGGSAAVIGVITTQMVPRITTESYLPFFVLGALLVALAVLSVWLVGGNIKPASAQ